jgi:DNA segregation ATPase FtsK/SpoIIIE, S-DNA-T family
MVKRKKKKSEEDVEDIERNKQVKKSIFSVIFITLIIMSFLSLFNLAGLFGILIDSYLSLIFGYGKWLFPLILLFFALKLIFPKSFTDFKAKDYIGLILFFIAYQTLFHFFFASDKALMLVDEGIGGGYIGYYLSLGIKSLFDFWGGLIILLAIFLTALVLFLNKPLSKIIGSETFLFRMFKKKEKEEIEEKRDDQEEETKKEENQVSTSLWQEKDLPKVVENKIKEVSDKIVWEKRKVKLDLPIELLNSKYGKAVGGDIKERARVIEKTLENFGIEVEMVETKVGPTVTQYAFKPAQGIKLSRITTLNNDLSLALAAHPLRIEAPIPGKSLVGIEVPNEAKAIVGLREILEDKAFKERTSNMMIALGKDVAGNAWLYNLNKMPHLLVAGATNSGKSVCLNAIIVSLLYQNNPENLRFIMVDPKRVELPAYNGIPHLLTPVITEVSKTINSLKWCLNEMDRRYDLLNKLSSKNIASYNLKSDDKLPYIVFIIDELADFMMTAGKEMEAAIIRLAQMSRAVGIHLILATQRPSVDVITGLIKANVPARIAFSVASLVDSKTILDQSGAEKLLGQGDMLFTSADVAKPKRLQGAFVSDEEINDIINYIKEKSGPADYLEGITDRQKVSGIAGVGLDGTHGDEDELLSEAKEIILQADKASTSLLQRRLSIGYGRAAKILDMLEQSGIVGPANGSKPREILISQQDKDLILSGVSLHNKEDSKALDNYLPDQGNDDTLSFNNNSNMNNKEEEKKDPDFLLDDDGPEDEVKSTGQIMEEIKKNDDVPPRAFSDDEEDDGMFFSR